MTKLDEARETNIMGQEIFRPTIHNVEGGYAFQVRVEIGPNTFITLDVYEASSGRNQLQVRFRQYASYVPGRGARTEKAADLLVYDIEYAKP